MFQINQKNNRILQMLETKDYIRKRLLKDISKMDQFFRVFLLRRDYLLNRNIILMRPIDKFVEKSILTKMEAGKIFHKINLVHIKTGLNKAVKIKIFKDKRTMKALNISKLIFLIHLITRVKEAKIKAGLISI